MLDLIDMIIYDKNIVQTVPEQTNGLSIKTGIHYLQKKLKEQKKYRNTRDKDTVVMERKIEHGNIDGTDKSPQTLGLAQHAQDVIVKIEEDKNKLNELIRKSNRCIISISSVFPWNFFPNTIDVEESRITIIFRQLLTSQSHSLDIKDISNVRIESGFFFATLQIVSRTFTQNDIKIEYLKKKDAYRAKDIIEGLRTFVHNDINSSNYEISDLIKKLKELNFQKN